MQLSEALVRACLIVEMHERGDEAPQVLLGEDKNVIEEFASQRADDRSAKAFMSGAWIAVRTTCVSTVAKTPVNLAPNFASLSQTSTCGAVPSNVALRACCAHQASVGAYVTAA